ncbi:hypothetical protein [Algoriphagus machipongonensis]|uniref:Sugar transporter n=1 Tax=Algoriphagus machipongonensis TaxID=388413 RepID=A3HSW5_9BACT|nr:hypothetical protein [Algoriphagus machipongonensis]EAZ82933.1 sugar transporter [Algoriphagus machipongonensis]
MINLNGFSSIYELALKALDTKDKLSELIQQSLSEEKLEYDSIYQGNSEWKLLPSFDHPDSPFSYMFWGTGLTHHNSFLNRQMMHSQAEKKPFDCLIW